MSDTPKKRRVSDGPLDNDENNHLDVTSIEEKPGAAVLITPSDWQSLVEIAKSNPELFDKLQGLKSRHETISGEQLDIRKPARSTTKRGDKSNVSKASSKSRATVHSKKSREAILANAQAQFDAEEAEEAAAKKKSKGSKAKNSRRSAAEKKKAAKKKSREYDSDEEDEANGSQDVDSVGDEGGLNDDEVEVVQHTTQVSGVAAALANFDEEMGNFVQNLFPDEDSSVESAFMWVE